MCRIHTHIIHIRSHHMTCYPHVHDMPASSTCHVLMSSLVCPSVHAHPCACECGCVHVPVGVMSCHVVRASVSLSMCIMCCTCRGRDMYEPGGEAESGGLQHTTDTSRHECQCGSMHMHHAAVHASVWKWRWRTTPHSHEQP